MIKGAVLIVPVDDKERTLKSRAWYICSVLMTHSKFPKKDSPPEQNIFFLKLFWIKIWKEDFNKIESSQSFYNFS